MDFAEYFNSHQEEMIQLLKKIVSQESPSTDKKAVDRCSAFLIKEFRKLGAKITCFPQPHIGDLYLVEYLPQESDPKKEQVLILTHLDTVWPVGKIKEMPFHIKGKKVYGPGVLDMKAGLVMVFFALKALKEKGMLPKKKIVIFINSAEEIGSKDSYRVIQRLARKSSFALCLEPSLPGGNLKMQRKGRLVLRLEAHGKAAHGGTPEMGVNAIEELVGQFRLLNKLRAKGTTVNIGVIQGGEKSNIVPQDAWALLDIRFWKSSQKQKILDFFEHLTPSLEGARVKFTIESYTPPMEKTDASWKLFRKIRKIGYSLNMALEGGKTGGGSDASIVANMGIPTVDGLGPDGVGIHAENEHLFRPSLIKRATLLTQLLIHL
ncbi:MAG: M20/M25/M40 family metallo-hydrolase [Candidatus Aminicenantes bacterium]|nr:M20/M25/M40 family metallo-hydrolase [Candidatus Aminicenantes bacterium]